MSFKRTKNIQIILKLKNAMTALWSMLLILLSIRNSIFFLNVLWFSILAWIDYKTCIFPYSFNITLSRYIYSTCIYNSAFFLIKFLNAFYFSVFLQCHLSFWEQKCSKFSQLIYFLYSYPFDRCSNINLLEKLKSIFWFVTSLWKIQEKKFYILFKLTFNLLYEK